MAHEVKWLVEGRVMYQRLYDTITLEEYQQVQAKGAGMFAQGKPPVTHNIVDVLDLKKAPSITEIMRLPHVKNPPGMGWMVLAIENPLFRFMGSVIAQFVVPNIKLVRTLDEAYTFLNRLDTTLPPLATLGTTPTPLETSSNNPTTG